MAPDKRGSRRKEEINAVTQETLASICGEQCSFVFSRILLRSIEWALLCSTLLGDNAQFCLTPTHASPLSHFTFAPSSVPPLRHPCHLSTVQQALTKKLSSLCEPASTSD